jgi:hypothetical protein
MATLRAYTVPLLLSLLGAVALQVVGQHLADLAVIVDDKDERNVVHCVLDEDGGQGRAARPW